MSCGPDSTELSGSPRVICLHGPDNPTIVITSALHISGILSHDYVVSLSYYGSSGKYSFLAKPGQD